jgi:RNA polymerase sigma-70 factor, ECF subfamily
VGDEGGRQIPAQHAAELARFYQANAQWLAGHAHLRITRDRDLVAARELAADLVQDTFEAAAREWKTLRVLVPAQQRAWLRKTLWHKDTDQFRRRRVWRLQLPELHRRYQAAEPDYEQQALNELALEKTAQLIEGLPDEQRVIALMKWNDHMTESEIAARLGCTREDVTAQVRKIRRKLIDGLGPYYPFAGDAGEGEAS